MPVNRWLNHVALLEMVVAEIALFQKQNERCIPTCFLTNSPPFALVAGYLTNRWLVKNKGEAWFKEKFLLSLVQIANKWRY